MELLFQLRQIQAHHHHLLHPPYASRQLHHQQKARHIQRVALDYPVVVGGKLLYIVAPEQAGVILTGFLQKILYLPFVFNRIQAVHTVVGKYPPFIEIDKRIFPHVIIDISRTLQHLLRIV